MSEFNYSKPPTMLEEFRTGRDLEYFSSVMFDPTAEQSEGLHTMPNQGWIIVGNIEPGNATVDVYRYAENGSASIDIQDVEDGRIIDIALTTPFGPYHIAYTEQEPSDEYAKKIDLGTGHILGGDVMTLDAENQHQQVHIKTGSGEQPPIVRVVNGDSSVGTQNAWGCAASMLMAAIGEDRLDRSTSKQLTAMVRFGLSRARIVELGNGSWPVGALTNAIRRGLAEGVNPQKIADRVNAYSPVLGVNSRPLNYPNDEDWMTRNGDVMKREYAGSLFSEGHFPTLESMDPFDMEIPRYPQSGL